MKMNIIHKLLAGVGGGAALVLLGAGVLTVPHAAAQIKDTKHNFGSSASAATRLNSFSGTGEICVFCHTPHGSDTSAAVPLWNRTLGTPSNYTTYNSLGTSSLDGATAPVGSVSLACLSCHDGTQAMNVLINAPGSGKTVAGYTAGSWGSSTGIETTGLVGRMKSDLIANLSQDLQNDHPIGIQYAGGPDGTIPAAGTDYTSFKDKDFKTAKSDQLNGQPVWWVETTGSGDGRQKTDMQLYTRKDATSVNKNAAGNTFTISGAQPFVECASCHDPHTTNTTFLRIANTGSAVCLACHSK